MFARLFRYFSLRPYWIALLITVLLLFWMLVKPANEPLSEIAVTANNQNLPKVQISHFIPKEVTKYLTFMEEVKPIVELLFVPKWQGKL